MGSNSSDSIHGLKFGQKIYFEDHGSPGIKPCGSGFKKGKATPSTGPPRCQVEDCHVDLSDSKAYYSRHKVCGMHSKSPKVVVGGLEQRFCQQCSRFHLLPEFDQGKRSCRRRLAGHNERRRKPPPGSLLSPRYARFPSSIFDGGSARGGGFLLNFAGNTMRDSRQAVRSSEWATGNQVQNTGKYVLHPWQSNSENSQNDLFYMQGSSSNGECFSGVAADSNCALSLLSNQPWGPRSRATSNHFFGNDEIHMGQPGQFQGAMSQLSQPIGSEFGESGQHGVRSYMDIDRSRAYDSTIHNMHWAL